MNVAVTIAELADMTVKELRRRYAEVFGETTNSRHKGFLRRRIIWRMQAQAEGGLSKKAQARAKELADNADLRLSAPRQAGTPAGRPARRVDNRLPMPGTAITREYKGETVEVRVLEEGFEYAGAIYRTLSGVARAVTGAHWNGYRFFNLGEKGNGNGGKKK